MNLVDAQLQGNLRKEKLDYWVNSFGGARSNFITNALRTKYKVKSPSYDHRGCHYIRPLDVGVKMGIFCYVEDIGIALSSQINRKYTFNFNKLKDDPNASYSITKWLDLIEQQINNWTSSSFFPILIINTDSILDHKSNFEKLFNVELGNYRQRSTVSYHPSLEENQNKIDEINDKLRVLPNFEIV